MGVGGVSRLRVGGEVLGTHTGEGRGGREEGREQGCRGPKDTCQGGAEGGGQRRVEGEGNRSGGLRAS